jgi:hypothetical protein
LMFKYRKKMESGRLEKLLLSHHHHHHHHRLFQSHYQVVYTHKRVSFSLLLYIKWWWWPCFLKVKSRNDDCSPCGHWDYELFLSFSFLKNRRQKRTFIFVKEKKAARCTYTHTRE